MELLIILAMYLVPIAIGLLAGVVANRRDWKRVANES